MTLHCTSLISLLKYAQNAFSENVFCLRVFSIHLQPIIANACHTASHISWRIFCLPNFSLRQTFKIYKFICKLVPKRKTALCVCIIWSPPFPFCPPPPHPPNHRHLYWIGKQTGWNCNMNCLAFRNFQWNAMASSLLILINLMRIFQNLCQAR